VATCIVYTRLTDSAEIFVQDWLVLLVHGVSGEILTVRRSNMIWFNLATSTTVLWKIMRHGH
jgi:hypothetical protein